LSAKYSAIKWTGARCIYDVVMTAGIILYLAGFVFVGKRMGTGSAPIPEPVLLMRAFGTCALLLLHLVLCIGPLARFDRRFLLLLSNRRHLGVATFLVALTHAVLTVGHYRGYGRLKPVIALFIGDSKYGLTAFPFETLGLAALVILFLMAATSHDFWLKNLSPGVWKGLHMLVYPAYGLLVMHVALGALQADSGWLGPGLLGLGIITVGSLQLAAGLRERRRDIRGLTAIQGGNNETWFDVGSVDQIPHNRALTVCLANQERVAVFRYNDRISAVTNVCAHQGGPLGEGKIIDGCITCPWHGWEYRPQDGRSPPPFTEKIATYRVRVKNRRILLDPEAQPPGTEVEPAGFEEPESQSSRKNHLALGNIYHDESV
jgi:nitrite reductase/ring-hydroxylating ferredoxin subunit/DMSO/TMAO reductase YedYZ heme-binding membrane subunit